MRLTLRTLLAYLDSTLDPADSDLLRQKVEQSAFAGNLVRRIRGCMGSDQLSAPPPDAAGPIEDANTISEYLDSTLTPEQIAEIERTCLESDPTLAEVAACHQLLTLILSEPAEVQSELRQKIYRLAQSESVQTAGSFTSLDIPEEDHLGTRESGGAPDEARAPATTGEPSDFAVANVDSNSPAFPPVAPVGPTDSGVSDAPTRIRSIDRDDTTNGKQPPVAAGPRLREWSGDYYGGIRTSRITPWLVTLALLGLLGFTLMKVVEPLMKDRPQANQPLAPEEPDTESDRSSAEPRGVTPAPETGDEIDGEDEIDVPVQDTPPMVSVGSGARNLLPEPEPSLADETETLRSGSEASASSDASPSPTAAGDTLPTPSPDSMTTEPGSSGEDASTTNVVSELPITDAAPTTGDGESDAASTVPSSPESTSDDLMTETNAVASVSPEPSVTPESSDPDRPAEVTVTETDGMLIALKPDASADDGFQAVKLQTDATVSGGVKLVAPDWFRARLTMPSGDQVGMVGPAKIGLPDPTSGPNSPGFTLVHGTVHLQLGSSDPVTIVDFDDRRLAIRGDGVTLAMNLTHKRKPGVDPLDVKTPRGVVQVYASESEATIELLRRVVSSSPADIRQSDVESESTEMLDRDLEDSLPDDSDDETSGDVDVGRDEDSGPVGIKPEPEKPEVRYVSVGQPLVVSAGELMVWESGREPVVSMPQPIPDWAEEGGSELGTVQQSAREGLLAITKSAPNIAVGLREAVPFRRSEVGALAARTLLWLDRGEVYFGGRGVFNDPDQKLHWKDHFLAVQQYINTDRLYAERMHEAIRMMESADLEILHQLLVGFSNEELKSGADASLVGWLDAPVMAIRVLALENLRMITGTTNYFDPVESNASSRRSDINKWEVRMRRGQIRME